MTLWRHSDLRFFGVTVRVHTRAEEDDRRVRYYYHDYLVADPGTPAYEVALEADGGAFVDCGLDPSVPKRVWLRSDTEWALYEEYFRAASQPTLLPPFRLPPLSERYTLRHGAAVSPVAGQGEALAIVGPSGSGKTTLLCALAERGWCFLSDDHLVTEGGGRMVWPFTRPVGLREAARRVLRDQGAARRGERVRTESGTTTMAHARDLGWVVAGSPRPLRWVCRVRNGRAFTFTRDSPRVMTMAWDPESHLNQALESLGEALRC